jgi:hypothetical protein
MNLASKVEEMGHLSPNKLVGAYLKAGQQRRGRRMGKSTPFLQPKSGQPLSR